MALVSPQIHSKGSLSHPLSYSHWTPAFCREVWASQRPFSLVPWATCFWERLSHYKLPLGATLAYTWPREKEGKSPQSPKALHLSARTGFSINKFFHIKAGTNSYPGWKPGWRMRMWYGAFVFFLKLFQYSWLVAQSPPPAGHVASVLPSGLGW